MTDQGRKGTRLEPEPLLSRHTRNRLRAAIRLCPRSIPGRGTQPASLRLLGQFCALLGIAAAYGAAHWIITVALMLDEHGHYANAQTIASRMVATIERLYADAGRGGSPLSPSEEAAVDQLDRDAAWFTAHWSYSTGDSDTAASSGQDDLSDWLRYRRTGVVAKPDPTGSPALDALFLQLWQVEVAKAEAGDVDPAGDLKYARSDIEDLPTAVESGREALEYEIHHTAELALGWGAGAVLVLPHAVASLLRRGSAKRSEIVALARRYTRRRPIWSRPAFAGMTAAGWTLLWLGVIASGSAVRGRELPWQACLVAAVGGPILALVGILILKYSQPRSVKDPVRALVQDGRAPVLYLRSFADDRTAASVDLPATPGEAGMLEIESREEQFATVLGSLGPVVTVGRPHERIPPLGAVRLYLPPGDWQPRVMQLMDLAALVVIRLGAGASLWWEFAYCVRHLAAQKVIVLVPGAPLPVGLVEELDRHLPVPSRLDAIVARSGAPWTSVVLAFDPSWRPQAVAVGPLPRARWRGTPGHQLARALQDALATVGIRRRALGYRINRKRLATMGKIFLLLPAAYLVLHLMELIRELM